MPEVRGSPPKKQCLVNIGTGNCIIPMWGLPSKSSTAFPTTSGIFIPIVMPRIAAVFAIIPSGKFSSTTMTHFSFSTQKQKVYAGRSCGGRFADMVSVYGLRSKCADL